ncbi:PREDICTED: uncharacterized protein LOC105448016 [Wasmannia auropunctata]|uniref:uncharacterized protein LOC105448016 n=1 Tax=Wasmannia auropunctata TaxID=64793 RepID=UPI0005EDEEB8|nr:PREDICTED: uncharacterized protein LOC105448016 [Wasmannia auropunctata]
MKEPEVNLPELRAMPVTLMSTQAHQLLTKYSSYHKLCRIVAFCYKFAENSRSGKRTTPITAAELDKAEKIVICWVQQEAKELCSLQEGRTLPRKNALRALAAYLSEDDLILRDRHERLLHCPPEQLLHDVRERFWPIGGRRETRKVVKKCIKCYCFNPIPAEVKMGDLPAERVRSFNRPFTTTGLDYAGPIQVREIRRQGRIHISKGYIAIFVCTSTKAVHLEIVTDLTTDSFLAALRRFVACRGLCAQIFFDNGTNFVGAVRHLKELYEFMNEEQEVIKSELADQRIEWQFIPPRAPNFGGLWEAAVKSAKRYLFTVTKGRIHTYEEYSTILAQIEAVLNSRPLTPLSSDPLDLSVLTPAHFLVGGSLLQPAQVNHLNTPDNSLAKWQKMQK